MVSVWLLHGYRFVRLVALVDSGADSFLLDTDRVDNVSIDEVLNAIEAALVS